MPTYLHRKCQNSTLITANSLLVENIQLKIWYNEDHFNGLLQIDDDNMVIYRIIVMFKTNTTSFFDIAQHY